MRIALTYLLHTVLVDEPVCVRGGAMVCKPCDSAKRSAHTSSKCKSVSHSVEACKDVEKVHISIQVVGMGHAGSYR